MVSAVRCVRHPVWTRTLGLVNGFFLTGLPPLFEIAEPEITRQQVFKTTSLVSRVKLCSSDSQLKAAQILNGVKNTSLLYWSSSIITFFFFSPKLSGSHRFFSCQLHKHTLTHPHITTEQMNRNNRAWKSQRRFTDVRLDVFRQCDINPTKIIRRIYTLWCFSYIHQLWTEFRRY